MIQFPAPPDFSIEQAEQVAQASYGLSVRAEPLAAERDRNFALFESSRVAYVLKVANPVEPMTVSKFQACVLEHIAMRDPDFPSPRLIRNREGQLLTRVWNAAEQPLNIRMLSWKSGRMLREFPMSAEIAASLGELLGRINTALCDFQHRGADQEINWDMKRAAGLESWLPFIVEPALRDLAEQRLADFTTHLVDKFDELPWQVIYNDLNPSNVLLDDEGCVSGLIDFGDSVHAPRIIDLATAAAYLLRDEDDPFVYVRPLIHRYCQRIDVSSREWEVFFRLMLIRHTMTVIITNRRADLHPENRAYIMRNCGHAQAMLKRFATIPNLSIDEVLK